jgi:hypothetical protein
MKVLGVILLTLASLSLINGQDNPNADYTCITQCSTQYQAWLSSWVTNGGTTIDWSASCTGTVWTDLYTCVSSCPPGSFGPEWKASLEDWKNTCAEHNYVINLPPGLGDTTNTGVSAPPVVDIGSTGVTIDPTGIVKCATACQTQLTAWTAQLTATNTNIDYASLCGTKWDAVKSCLTTNCQAGLYGILQSAISGAQNACAAKGFPINTTPPSGGSNNPNNPGTLNAAHSMTSVSGLGLIAVALLAILAMLVA